MLKERRSEVQQEMDEFVVWFVLCRGYEDISSANVLGVLVESPNNVLDRAQKLGSPWSKIFGCSPWAYGEEFLSSSMERENLISLNTNRFSWVIIRNQGCYRMDVVIICCHAYLIHASIVTSMFVILINQAVKTRLHESAPNFVCSPPVGCWARIRSSKKQS